MFIKKKKALSREKARHKPVFTFVNFVLYTKYTLEKDLKIISKCY